MGIEWIDHKGKKILYVDYRNKTGPEKIPILHQFADIVRNASGIVLAICNYEKGFTNQEFLDELNKLGKELNSKLKTASLGISGVKKIFFQSYLLFSGDKNSKIFENEEKAKDWLVS